MKKTIVAFMLLSLLTACGATSGLRDSKLNPFNWFGGDTEETVAVDEFVDPRGLVAEIISLRVDRMPGGAIIHAVGLPDTQGYYEAELVPLNGELPDKGVLSYEFRLLPPLGPEPVSTKRSREVLVGHFISDQAMVGVRRIQVIAARNRRTVTR